MDSRYLVAAFIGVFATVSIFAAATTVRHISNDSGYASPQPMNKKTAGSQRIERPRRTM